MADTAGIAHPHKHGGRMTDILGRIATDQNLDSDFARVLSLNNGFGGEHNNWVQFDEAGRRIGVVFVRSRAAAMALRPDAADARIETDADCGFRRYVASQYGRLD